MIFIKLSEWSDRSKSTTDTYVNVGQIQQISRSKIGSSVTFPEFHMDAFNYIIVTETPEQIIALIEAAHNRTLTGVSGSIAESILDMPIPGSACPSTTKESPMEQD